MKKLNIIITIILVSASLFGQKVDILGDAKITGKVEIMDTIMFADGSMLAKAPDGILSDADNDTQVLVEDKPDEDRIRFQVGGVEAMRLDATNLRLAFGINSIYIGNGTGLSDDGNNSNVVIGTAAGSPITSGRNNTIIGNYAAGNMVLGSDNVIIGSEAGSEEDGSNNTFIGRLSGFGNAGTGNVFLGYEAGYSSNGNDKLIIANSDTPTPLLHGEFNTGKLAINGTQNLGAANFTIHDLDGSFGGMYVNATSSGLPFYGYALGGVVKGYHYMDSNDKWTFWKGGTAMVLDATNNLGLGTTIPEAKLHVKSFNSAGHVMKIENTSTSVEADGLEILINRPTTGGGNNFVTFKDSDGIAGRIEGFNIGEGNGFTSFPDFEFSAYWNPVTINSLAFSPGQLPQINSLGTLPSLNINFPTLNFVKPTLDFELPSLDYTAPTLSGGVVSFSLSAMTNCILSGGFNCSNPLSATPISFNDGSLDFDEGYINFTQGSASLSGGSVSFNQGTLPNITPGQLPTFNIDAIIDPIPNVNAYINLKDVMCWALENGERSLITTNPWDLRMLVGSSFLNNLADCKNGGVTYGSGGADYAEYLLRESYEEHMEEGQIVGVKGGKISKNTEGAEQLLVISMMPIVLGNMPDDTLTIDQYEKVAFLGQAPVWVIGKVRSGDYIIPSGRNDGYGLAVAPEELTLDHVSKVVGRAWTDSDQAVNLINMVIGSKTNEMATILNNFSKEMVKMDSRLERIEAALNINDIAEQH